MSDDYEEYDDSERKSRSQKKRESTAMQRVGEELAQLSVATLKKLAVPSALIDELESWKRFKGHESKRRQMQYIGRLIREMDVAERLAEALDELRSGHDQANQIFHLAEQWRDKLLAAGPKDQAELFEEAMAVFPGVDLKQLRHLVTAYQGTGDAKVMVRFSRELFRYLRDSGDRKL